MMAITKNTQYGNINIAIEAIASLAGGVVSECYGVVGMASQKIFKDGLAELLYLHSAGPALQDSLYSFQSFC